jgi:hypothetical protein
LIAFSIGLGTAEGEEDLVHIAGEDLGELLAEQAA